MFRFRFRSVIHSELNVSVWYEVWVTVLYFVHGYPPFVKKAVLALIKLLCAFASAYFCIFYSISLFFLSILNSVLYCLYDCSFILSLEVR